MVIRSTSQQESVQVPKVVVGIDGGGKWGKRGPDKATVNGGGGPLQAQAAAAGSRWSRGRRPWFLRWANPVNLAGGRDNGDGDIKVACRKG